MTISHKTKANSHRIDCVSHKKIKEKKMLVVKKGQMDAIAQLTNEKFEKEAMVYLKEKYPVFSQTNSDAQIRQIIKQGIQKAALYKITDNKDTLHFLEYTASLGVDFERKPENEWAKKILLIRNLNGREKVSRMLNKQTP